MQSHSFFNKKTLSQKKPLTIQTAHLTTKELLRTIAHTTYSEKAAYKQLESYTEKTHFEYDKFGILVKTDKPDCYSLYLYNKPTRNNSAVPKKQTISLFVDINDDIVCDSMKDLHRAILLHSLDGRLIPVDLTKSTKYKTVVKAKQNHPFPHDHFIYLSFINTKNNMDTPHVFKENIPKIKKYFNQSEDITFHLLRFYTPKNINKKLKRAAKKYDLRSKLSNGKIYLILDAHCLEGSDHLNSEHPNDTGENQAFEYSINDLINIIQRLHIPKTSELDIDVYACLAGKASEEHPSFIQQFSDALRSEGFTNFTVKGNTDTVYGIYKPYPHQVMTQSPMNVHVFGEIREPLTSIEKLKNTEPYIRIMGLTKNKPDILYRNDTINALKKRASETCRSAEDHMTFDKGYQELKQLSEEFFKFDALAKEIKEHSPVASEQNAIYEKSLKKIHKMLERQYKITSITFDFKNAYESLLENYAAFKAIDESPQPSSFRPM